MLLNEMKQIKEMIGNTTAGNQVKWHCCTTEIVVLFFFLRGGAVCDRLSIVIILILRRVKKWLGHDLTLDWIYQKFLKMNFLHILVESQ